MHKKLRPEQVDILVGSPGVGDEFSKKVKELDRRLKMNGMQYRDWDLLNDRQHDIFTDNLFLDGECATDVDSYVKGAVNSCGCPDTEEELHHHSPVLMREIEKQQDMLPDMKVKMGEGLDNLNETIDLMVESLLAEKKDSKCGPGFPNRGDITEGIVAAALVAKFAKRVPEEKPTQIGDVTSDDIKKYVRLIKQQGMQGKTTVNDFEGTTDTIQWSVQMPKGPFAALTDQNLEECLENEYNGTVKYVNQENITKWATRLAKNNQANEIVIAAEGTSDQKTTKVDISIVVDGDKKALQVSLKVKGSDLIAQKTGIKFDVLADFWGPMGVTLQNVQSKYEAKIANIPTGKTFKARNRALYNKFKTAANGLRIAYSEAAKELGPLLKNNPDAVIEGLIKYVRTGATRDDPSVELVKISGGEFKKARFGPAFEKKMRTLKGLDVVYTESPGKKRIVLPSGKEMPGTKQPTVSIYANTGPEGQRELLVKFRGKMEAQSSPATATRPKMYGVVVRNYLEVGDGLFRVAGI